MRQKINIAVTEKTELNEILRQTLSDAVKNSGINIDSKSFSNSKIRRLIVSGSVYVNGWQMKRPSFIVTKNSMITVDFDRDRFSFEKHPDDITFTMSDDDVLFETDNLIFVNKPAFFPVEQTITGKRANLHDALVDYLWKRNPSLRNPPYAGIMHRLDRETSGVILFTKNRAANKEISEMFQSHDFYKEYLAAVAVSSVKKSLAQNASNLSVGYAFTVEKFMGRISSKSSKGKWGSLSEKQGGQYSKTDFEIIGTKKIEGTECFIIRCVLFTGRTHQIRVHLSEAGFPIFGDELYGGKKASRLYLHAQKLEKIGKFSVTCDCNW